MTAEASLLLKLTTYLTRHIKLDSNGLKDAFGWPLELEFIRGNLPSFAWLSANGPPLRIFGIRRLIGQAPFRLSDLRTRGYRTESLRHPVRPPVKGSVDHYLIAEILGPKAAVIFLCIQTQEGEWFVLDEHRIQQA